DPDRSFPRRHHGLTMTQESMKVHETSQCRSLPHPHHRPTGPPRLEDHVSLPPLDLTLPTDTLRIVAWPDAVIDQLGHDPRSSYAERFWLPILGPSTYLFLRRVVAGLDDQPD